MPQTFQKLPEKERKFQVAELSDIFKGYDPKKVQEAMKKAKMLSQNPRVQEAFSRVDQEEIVHALKNFDDMDKRRVLNTFLKGDNRELIRLIKSLK